MTLGVERLQDRFYEELYYAQINFLMKDPIMIDLDFDAIGDAAGKLTHSLLSW